MRILVVSDTHGLTSKVRDIFFKLEKEHPCDAIIHCGDYFNDAKELDRMLPVPVIKAKGNCDDAGDGYEHAFLDTELGRVLVTHGHLENVNYSMERLYYTALENDCILACFGHTHRALFTEVNGVYIMNPGSLSKPRDGSTGTFGIIDTGSGFVSGRIYSYDEFMTKAEAGGGDAHAPAPKKKVKGGHLRDMINYSDRF